MSTQSWALVLVAAVAALIAYLQWVTAHQRVVVDLFDRRRRAFESVEDALRPVFREAEVSADTLHRFFAAKFQCRFLFGQDVSDYLDSLHKDVAFLNVYNNALIDRSPDRSKLIDQKYERLGRILEFYNVGVPIFVQYIRLDQKMRYFWPFPNDLTVSGAQDENKIPRPEGVPAEPEPASQARSPKKFGDNVKRDR